MLILLAMMFMPVGATPVDLQTDEVAVFFSTSAHFDSQEQVWRVPVHAWVYEPEADSLKRAALVGLLRRLGRLEEGSERSEIFRQRLRPFLVDNERGKRLVIRLGARTYTLEPTAANGHAFDTLDLPAAEADALLGAKDDNRRIEFRAVLPEGDGRVLTGAVQLAPETGVSVISDIDDTVKISHVADRQALIRNTFSEEFQAVPGMAAVYRRWAQAGAMFHYVSASPWQLYVPLTGFLAQAGFPDGSFEMKLFRIKDGGLKELTAPPDEFKRRAIEPLLAAFPRRTFVLVGDSGERDPEIFGELSRKHPGQIARIFIRNTTEETADSARIAAAFADLPAKQWRLFHDPSEIDGDLRDLATQR